MHSPVSTQALAHLRAASGPSPLRRISMTPAMTARGAASTPPGPVTGQTSTHLPQRVQVSAIAATRADNAVSNVSVMPPRAPPGPRLPRPRERLKPSPGSCWRGGGTTRRLSRRARRRARTPAATKRSARSNLRSDPSERIVPDRGHHDVVVGRNITPDSHEGFTFDVLVLGAEGHAAIISLVDILPEARRYFG